MNSVHQETKPTYVLIVRSPCSHTRNHHHPRQHDHGTPRSIHLSHSVSVSKSHLCQSKGNIGGPSNGRLAHGMGQVHHFVRGGDGGTLDLQAWQICRFIANQRFLHHSFRLLPAQRTTSVKIESLKCITIGNTQFKLLVFLFPSQKGGVSVKTVVNFLSEMFQSSCFWLSPLIGLSQVRWFDCSDFYYSRDNCFCFGRNYQSPCWPQVHKDICN